MSRRRLKITLMLFAVPVVLCIAFLLIERFRGQIALASFRRELVARGEKTSPAELLVETGESENGAPAFHKAIRELKDGIVLPKHPPPKMSVLPSGRAIIGFLQSEWIEENVTNTWAHVERDLRTNATVFATIQEALEMPSFNNNLDYAQGAMLLLPHLASAKPLSAWFSAQTQLALRQNRNGEATASLIALAWLPRVFAEDRVLISEHVRIAVSAFGKSALWEGLQSSVLIEDDLFAVQNALESQGFAANMVQSLEGDRVFSDVSYDLFRQSNDETAKALFGLEAYFPIDEDDRSWWERSLRKLPYGESVAEGIKKQIFCRIWRFAWSHQDQCRGMRNLHSLTEIARLGTTNKSLVHLRTALENLKTEAESERFYDRLRYPFRNPVLTPSGSVVKSMQAETERSIALSAIALKRHSLRHGKFPDTLDALVPEFLTAVPIDYMDGAPIKYRLNDDGSFRLYSVGEDGKDDGGDASLLPEKTNVRNLWDRKDFFWPAPATAEEIETYRKESANQ